MDPNHHSGLPANPDRGVHHWILHARSRYHHFRGTGTTSIKSFTGGSALYVLDQGECTLDATCYMLLNEGQPYDIAIDAPHPMESFCIFFRPGFAQQVYRDLTARLPALLDDPTYSARLPVVDIDTNPRRHDDLVSPILRQLKGRPPDDPWALEEQLHRLMDPMRSKDFPTVLTTS